MTKLLKLGLLNIYIQLCLYIDHLTYNTEDLIEQNFNNKSLNFFVVIIVAIN